MITIHAIVRAFQGEFDYIQRNAIGSWLQLRPSPEIMLFGDDEPGAAEVATALDVPIYAVARNHRGIPLVKDPIEQAADLARHETRLLINADVILMRDFAQAAQRAMDEVKGPFLMIGRRHRVKVQGLIDLSDPGWERRLRRLVVSRGRLDGSKAVDWFLYRGDWMGQVPDFAVGRTAWDNWIVWQALRLGVPVVDATQVVMCVHQDHYKRRVAEETNENHALMDAVGMTHVAGFADATWRMTSKGIFRMR